MAQAALLAAAPDIIKVAPQILSDVGKGFRNFFGMEDVDLKSEQQHIEKLNKAKLEQDLATMNLSAAEKEKLRAYYANQQKAMFDQQLALAKLERDQEFSRSKQKVDNIKDL